MRRRRRPPTGVLVLLAVVLVLVGGGVGIPWKLGQYHDDPPTNSTFYRPLVDGDRLRTCLDDTGDDWAFTDPRDIQGDRIRHFTLDTPASAELVVLPSRLVAEQFAELVPSDASDDHVPRRPGDRAGDSRLYRYGNVVVRTTNDDRAARVERAHEQLYACLKDSSAHRPLGDEGDSFTTCRRSGVGVPRGLIVRGADCIRGRTLADMGRAEAARAGDERVSMTVGPATSVTVALRADATVVFQSGRATRR